MCGWVLGGGFDIFKKIHELLSGYVVPSGPGSFPRSVSPEEVVNKNNEILGNIGVCLFFFFYLLYIYIYRDQK